MAGHSFTISGAGKRLKHRITQIVIASPPVCLFASLGADCPNRNALVLTLQPEEDFALHVDVTVPDELLQLRTIPLHSTKFQVLMTRCSWTC